MAQRVTQVLVSDLTNEEMEPGEGQTVPFGLDGVDYEIDVFNDQADELRELLKPYIAAGRRTGGRAKPGRAPRVGGGAASADREQNQAIREWAQRNKYEISERGRIPGRISEAYHAAQGGRGSLAAVG